MSSDLQQPNAVRQRGALRSARNQFDIWEQRTALTRKMASDESAALDTRTAKLRALRLAKEEADRLAGPPPAPKPSPRRRRINVT